MKANYQAQTEKTIKENALIGRVPTLLLHSCCAPCSSYVLEYLSSYFKITVFYYNPNIYPDEEYFHRAKEQQEFIKKFPAKHPISFIEGDFEKDLFYSTARGLECEEEGGSRCEKCFELRLGKTAEKAKEMGFDYFTTTLSISPLKNSQLLNELGLRLQEEYSVEYLVSDFKKKEGFKRSTELSREYGMYRQNYCGCVFSLKEKEGSKKS